MRRTLKYAAMTRDEGNTVDGPFCSPQILSHSHPFGAVPGFSNLLINMELIGLKYCGGCNPVIDRSALVQEIRKLLPPGFQLVTEHSAAPYEKAVLVCGCPTACGERADLKGLAKRWIVISGPMVDLETVPEEKMAEVIIKKLNPNGPMGHQQK